MVITAAQVLQCGYYDIKPGSYCQPSFLDFFLFLTHFDHGNPYQDCLLSLCGKNSGLVHPDNLAKSRAEQ